MIPSLDFPEGMDGWMDGGALLGVLGGVCWLLGDDVNKRPN